MEDFPLHGLLPKRETQIEAFLRKYPHYNGDGTLIAIFDSGIDPGAPGFEKTPSGKRKVIDVIDCSGCGDVDTSTTVTMNTEDNTIEGCTGRKLKIPENWTNPSGNYFVGSKRLYSLFPSSPLRRVKNEKKEKKWDPAQKLAMAKANSRLVELETGSAKTEMEKLELENAKATVEALKKIEEKYDDCGPVYDCVVFNDGIEWKACIDTSEVGELAECKVMSSFHLHGEYTRFGDDDMVNYAFNVMEDGKKLSIITNSSSHGTHVASIASAYFEDQPELNGIAPGAQIISMQIGDNRVEGMETGTALIRAMKIAIERGVDVINLSYGESAKWCNSGRIIEMMHKVVTEHNIIFLSSAGNNGPAISTMGEPGASEYIIGVGAYVSPAMMVAGYSLLDKPPANQYTWSSVGPTLDGALGVCITAPGGAITSVPNWTLSKSQLMNGTSMSSPNACGGIAVLLSALKKEHIEYSPRSIRRSLENTASKIEGLSNLVQGYGLHQVDDAFEYMKKLSKIKISKYLSFKVQYGGNKRGIYLRELKDFNTPDKYHVTIKPEFHKDTDNTLKVDFNLKLCLVSDQPWVSCPSHLDMNNGLRTINLEIKKNSLKPGVHYAEICGYDLSNIELGPVFRVPITVVVPENRFERDECCIDIGKLSYKPGQRIRRFYHVPYGATWAELLLSSEEKERNFQYLIHAVQLATEAAYIEYEFDSFTMMKANGGDEKLAFKVKGGSTLELCLARYWSGDGDSELNCKLRFHGIEPSNQQVYLNGNSQFTRVDVTNKLCMEKLNPTASLTHHIMPLVPKENIIKPLGERDLLPNGEQIYSLEMTYNFSLPKGGEVLPYCPQLHDMLYENKFESQLWMCYDSNKRLIRSGEAFSLKYRYVCKLDKGDYVLRLQIRHSDVASLEGLKDMPINLQIKLATAIPLDVYSSRASLQNKQPKFTKKMTLVKDTVLPLYIAAPAEDKLPKGIKPGHDLTGTIKFTSDSDAKKCSIPMTMSAYLPKIPLDKSKENQNKETKPIEEQYKDAVDEFLGQWFAKALDTPIEEEIRVKFSDSLAAQDAILNALDGAKKLENKYDKVIECASKIRNEINVDKLLSYFGAKTQLDEGQLQLKEKLEKQKSIFINATYKMGLALSDKILEAKKTNETGEAEEVNKNIEDMNQCYRELAKFLDGTDSKMLMLTVRHGLAHAHYGRVLKALLAYFDENGYTKEYFDIYSNVVEQLGCQHIVEYLKKWRLVRFPSAYELF